MDFVIWILIGLGLLFLMMIVVGFVILYRITEKRKIRIGIILKTQRINYSRVKLTDLAKTKKYTHYSGAYIFDTENNKDCIIKGKYIDTIFFYQGNPNPIVFDFSQNIPRVMSQDLQKILDSSLIEKLFSEKRLERMEMLLIIILIVSAVSLLVVIGVIIILLTQGVNLKPSQENIDLIINATRKAIVTY